MRVISSYSTKKFVFSSRIFKISTESPIPMFNLIRLSRTSQTVTDYYVGDFAIILYQSDGFMSRAFILNARSVSISNS